jgi:hypothetical protein
MVSAGGPPVYWKQILDGAPDDLLRQLPCIILVQLDQVVIQGICLIPPTILFVLLSGQRPSFHFAPYVTAHTSSPAEIFLWWQITPGPRGARLYESVLEISIYKKEPTFAS